jgi:hypothetical protein
MAQQMPEPSGTNPHAAGRPPRLSLAGGPSESPADPIWFSACAWCKRIKLHGEWVDETVGLELIKLDRSGRPPRFSHGICPRCFDEVSATASAERLRRTGSALKPGR